MLNDRIFDIKNLWRLNIYVNVIFYFQFIFFFYYINCYVILDVIKQ